MSRECVLTDKSMADEIQEELNQSDRTYIPVNGDLHHCFYEAILCSLEVPVFPKAYNALTFRNQLLMYMMENLQFSLNTLKIRLQAGNTSFYHFILKHMQFSEWGEESLIPFICKMWHLNICVLDPLLKNDKYNTYGLTFGYLSSHYVIIIYNSLNHFTGTGYYFLFTKA